MGMCSTWNVENRYSAADEDQPGFVSPESKSTCSQCDTEMSLRKVAGDQSNPLPRYLGLIYMYI